MNTDMYVIIEVQAGVVQFNKCLLTNKEGKEVINSWAERVLMIPTATGFTNGEDLDIIIIPLSLLNKEEIQKKLVI